MPAATFATVKSHVASGSLAPLYVIVGDDERGKDDVAHALMESVPEDMRAFNFERVSAPDTDPAAIVASARTYPFLGERRMIVVVRAEKWLTGRKKGKASDEDEDEDGVEESAGAGSDVLVHYVESPEPSTTVVFVAADMNRTTRLVKALVKQAVIVECWGLKGEKELRSGGIAEALDRAARFVAAEAKKANLTIDRRALEPLLEHAGTNIATLRGDVDRLLLYCKGKTAITADDVRAVVGSATLINAWGITNAVERGHAAEALKQLRLAFESGAVPYMILGQLAWFVRSRLPMAAPGRVASAVDAVFRTDVAMKSSGGEPRVLLERLVVELCGVPSGARRPGR